MGEFKWSSQHLEMEVDVWDDLGVGRRLRQEARRCVHRAVRRWRGASTRQRFWLAIARPAYDDDRLSLISLTGSAGLASEEDPVAGLFIDGWTEGIPRRRVPTDIRIV